MSRMADSASVYTGMIERVVTLEDYLLRFDRQTIACPDCDLLQRLSELPPGGKARCARCGWVVATRTADPLDRPLALTFTALIALILANTAPPMGLSAVGRYASTTIVGGAYDMWGQGQEVTAVIVAFCAVIAPTGYIPFMLTVLLAVRWPPAPQWVGEMLRWAESMHPWSMNEVMMLGILRLQPHQTCSLTWIARPMAVLGEIVMGTARTADLQSQLPEYPSVLVEGNAHVLALVGRFAHSTVKRSGIVLAAQGPVDRTDSENASLLLS